MKNPFAEIELKPEADLNESGDEHQQKMAKRDAIYAKYAQSNSEKFLKFRFCK